MSGLTEETTKLRYITPAITQAGWDLEHISCEDYFFSDGKVIIAAKMVSVLVRVIKLIISYAIPMLIRHWL